MQSGLSHAATHDSYSHIHTSAASFVLVSAHSFHIAEISAAGSRSHCIAPFCYPLYLFSFFCRLVLYDFLSLSYYRTVLSLAFLCKL